MSNRNFMGLSGLLSIYPMSNFLKSIKYPLIIDFVLIIITIAFNVNKYKMIVFLSETIIGVIPNVLGFILTGYAVIISVTESKYLKIMVKKLPEKDITLYQTVNSTFAFVLVSLCVVLLVGFISKFFISADIIVIKMFSNCLGLINTSILFVLILFFLYSIFAIKDVIVNVFNFGQFINAIEKNIDNRPNNPN